MDSASFFFSNKSFPDGKPHPRDWNFQVVLIFFSLHTSCWSIVLPKADFCNEYNLANEEVGSTSLWIMDHVLEGACSICHFHLNEWREDAYYYFVLAGMAYVHSWLSRFGAGYEDG